MADFTYYCEVFEDRHRINKGIYTYCSRDGSIKYAGLNQFSDKVWRQGPKGGVKIVKDGNSRLRYATQYVTTDEKIMKEFMWVKLKAQPFTQGK